MEKWQGFTQNALEKWQNYVKIALEKWHNALRNVLNNEEYHIQQALVLCNDNLHVEENITYAPIYMLMFLHCKQRPKQSLFPLELPAFMK